MGTDGELYDRLDKIRDVVERVHSDLRSEIGGLRGEMRVQYEGTQRTIAEHSRTIAEVSTIQAQTLPRFREVETTVSQLSDIVVATRNLPKAVADLDLKVDGIDNRVMVLETVSNVRKAALATALTVFGGLGTYGFLAVFHIHP